MHGRNIFRTMGLLAAQAAMITSAHASIQVDLKAGRMLAPGTDIGPTDLPPTDLPPTDIGPTDVGPTDLGPTDVSPTDAGPTADLAVPLLQVTSDAFPNVDCSLTINADAQGALSNITYSCTNEAPQVFTMDQIKGGVTLLHDAPDNIDVVRVSAPSASATQGGAVVVNYLTNGISKTYTNWEFELVNSGQSWTAYTSPDNGHAAFNQMFMKKKTFLGKTIGIDSIQVQWENP